MAAKEKRKIMRPGAKVNEVEMPFKEEFIAETLQAIKELDSGLGKTFTSKKEFLQDLESL
jgi:antitoxin component of RelBE/YafQ-DinJ toxin-antitoxin module